MTDPSSDLSDDAWAEFEQAIRWDPGRRGLASFVENGLPLGAGQLRAAATDLAARGRAVAIVTGFCIVDAPTPAAETDGPPGALRLARMCVDLGMDVALVSDCYGLPLLKTGCDVLGLPRHVLHEFPFEPGQPDDDARRLNDPRYNIVTDQWIDEFLSRRPGSRLSHVVTIERVGPSHTPSSVAAQGHASADLERFASLAPAEHQNVCHNMRGTVVNGYTAKTHRLLEVIAERRLPITTIGIGDGGNELGMGRFRWETLCRAVAQGPAARTACRIATDHTIVAGVSNWVGYALALAVARLRGRPDVAAGFSLASERELIETIVAQTEAVDGVAKRRQAMVDGLPLESYLKPLADIKRIIAW